jgi:hypothetical protein
MYKHESKPGWHWFELYDVRKQHSTEAILCAYLATGEVIYKGIAKTSFDFLLSKTITENSIKVISNKGWLHNNKAVHKEVIEANNH